MKMIELHPVGQRVVIGQKLFSAEDIIRFAEKFDPQPFHTDAEAAKQFVFGALCASGWHTASNWMRTFIEYWEAETRRLLKDGIDPPRLGPSPGFRELQWLKPVFAGDTITYSITALESRPLASRPGRLMNIALCGGDNQHGEPVLRFKSAILEFDNLEEPA
ncbi:MaoC family dehydratase [Rhizobium sp. RU36D]|uniref:MaoC family dehydratase n=1 Tax=Rhizobium sp. RU36D TaxID=1907415 RepID=UPI0009D7D1D4|nr:MaoC family dehydratase [Rhizobium sp. RU36D]SMC61840.1 Acyl dehydratase [Rhizobium sp. RU36D]